MATASLWRECRQRPPTAFSWRSEAQDKVLPYDFLSSLAMALLDDLRRILNKSLPCRPSWFRSVQVLSQHPAKKWKLKAG